jgi:hypothetical protein
MKVSYLEGLANYNGPESCGAGREGGVEALTGTRPGRVFSRVRLLRDAEGCGWTHSLLRCAYQQRRAVHVSVPSGLAPASRALAPQSECPCALGPDAAPDRPLVVSRSYLSSLSPAPHGRHYLR